MRARVYKRNGGNWYLDYTDHRGKRVRKWAAEAKTKDDAQKALRRALTRQARISSGEIDALDGSANVADIIEAFLLHKLASRRYGTVRYYRAAFADMLGWFVTPDRGVWPPTAETPIERVKALARTFELGVLGVERADGITPDRVTQYVEARRAKVTVRTLNKSILALKTLLTWARKAGKIKSNPIHRGAFTRRQARARAQGTDRRGGRCPPGRQPAALPRHLAGVRDHGHATR